MTDMVTLIFYMVSGSQHQVSVPRNEVDGLLAQAADIMRDRGRLLLPGAKMLINGAHLVAVAPKGII